MRRFYRKCILAILVSVMVLGSLAVPAGAATRKLKNQSWTQVRAKADAKAKTVKVGTTTVRIPSKGKGFLKFTAPKKAEYSFTLSGLKAKKVKAKKTKTASVKSAKTKSKKRFSNGYFYVMTTYAGADGTEKIGQTKMITSGGETNTLWLATQKVQYGNKVGWRLKKRTGKLELEQGQVVYLYFNFTPGDRLKMKIAM